jgi:hypothetical protein
MLTIRNEQMRVFDDLAFRQFIRRIAADGRKRLPGCCSCLSDADLLTLCEESVATAATYGITDASDVPIIVDLVIAHGPGFAALDPFAWAGPLLTDPALSGDVKVAMLMERMPDHLRPETVSNSEQTEVVRR